MCWGADLLLGPDLLYGEVPGGSLVAKMTGITGMNDFLAVSKTAGPRMMIRGWTPREPSAGWWTPFFTRRIRSRFPHIHLRYATKMSMIQSETRKSPDKKQQKDTKSWWNGSSTNAFFRRVWWFIPCIHALMRWLPPWKSHGGHIPRWWLGCVDILMWGRCRWTTSRCIV